VLRVNFEAIVASGSNDAQPQWLEMWRLFGLAAADRGQLYAIPADLIQRHTPRILDGAERLCGFLEAARARS
jgi:iron complex transport system substrate-binding protein